ncbi:MAG: AraC family transcriptional regulator, partial [Coprobacillus sp.]
MKALISIIDELYSTQHIPCAIFDEEYQLIHPRITIINFKEFLNDIFTMAHHHVHILVYEDCVAYARLQVTYKNKPYFIIIGCILNNLEQSLPTSWTDIVPEHFIRSHVACIHLVTFQNFVKMIYEIVTHQTLSTQDIHIDYINKNNNHKKDDILTNRRVNQNTPHYYHWEQMLFDTYRQGDLHKVKHLLSQLNVFKSSPLTKDILQDQIFKLIGFITILTRINIQEGV